MSEGATDRGWRAIHMSGAAAHVQVAGGRAFFVGLRRLVVIAVIGIAATLLTWQTCSFSQQPVGVARPAEAPGKKCACPVMPGETVLIPCSSQLDPTSCGVCSVMSTDRKRNGRSCITIQ